MTEVQIEHDGTGFRCYVTETGIDREWRGPRWSTPKAAIRYAELIVATPSPLRVSVGRSDLMASLPGAVDIERPTEPRERLTGTAAGG